jgi:Ni/Fe-hydrogenase subunit HybB-like protein
MKASSFLNKRLAQGLVIGAISTIIIGFSWGGWSVNSTVKQKVRTASTSATVAALAPICAAKFELATITNDTLIPELEDLSYWQRDSHLIETGWATFPGGGDPNYAVAEACYELLRTSLGLK